MNARGLPALILVALAGCAEHVVNPAPAPPSIATLAISGATRTPEAIVTIIAKAQSSSAARAGAFTARLEYDPSVLAYVGEGESASGLVAFHDGDGVLKVAGASIEGFSESVLFRARFRVVKPLSSASIHLVIDELRDVSAGNRLPTDAGTRSAILRPWR